MTLSRSQKLPPDKPSTHIPVQQRILREIEAIQNCLLRLHHHSAFAKYSSPIFAQRKPNGRLRLRVDLSMQTTTHSFRQHSDVARKLACKKLFSKLDCSLKYHVRQMSDQLAHRFNRSYSSIMQEYIDSVIKVDKCTMSLKSSGLPPFLLHY